jgi:hypothetical protein
VMEALAAERNLWVAGKDGLHGFGAVILTTETPEGYKTFLGRRSSHFERYWGIGGW